MEIFRSSTGGYFVFILNNVKYTYYLFLNTKSNWC